MTTFRFAHEPTRDIAEEWPQHDFLLQRTGHDHVDLVVVDGLQNPRSRIFAALIMNT